MRFILGCAGHIRWRHVSAVSNMPRGGQQSGLKVVDVFAFPVNRSKASVLLMGAQPTHSIFVILEGDSGG